MLCGDDGAIIQPSVITVPSGTTFAGATLTSPTITSPTITGTNSSETKFCTTQLDKTSSVTLANIVGLTGFTLTAGGMYKFTVDLAGTATVNGGWKVGFKYTTATLTDIESTAKAFTASAVAVQHSTTTTDQSSLLASTTATIFTRLVGRITVNAGGPLAVQFAQNASHADTSSIYVGSSATLSRIS